MKKIIFFAALLIFMFPNFCKSDANISNKMSIFAVHYIKEDQDSEERFGEARFEPKLSYNAGNILFFAAGDFRIDSEGYAYGIMDRVTEPDNHRWAVNFKEAYVEYDKDKITARFGKQIFDLSVTDTISPSDNINPRDWTDLVEWERIGVPAFFASYGFDTSLEFIYVPWFTASKFPEDRWDRELPEGIKFGDQEYNRNSGQFSTRLKTTQKGWDLAAVFYKGKSFSPSYEINNIALEHELVPVYRDEEVYALSAATEIAGFNFRAETGYFHQEKDDDFIQYVGGVDREFSISGTDDSLYVLIQYANEIETQSDSPVNFRTFDNRRSLNNSFMSKLKYSFNDNLAAKLEGSYNFSDKDSYFEPAVSWQKDSWEIEAGFGFFSGPENSFFGGYEKNNRFFFKASYFF